MISPIKLVNNVANSAKTNKAINQINDFARGYTSGRQTDKLALKEILMRDMFTHKMTKHGKLTAFWQGVKAAVSTKK